MNKPIRVATIWHNESDHNDKHRRVRLELTKADDGYVWCTDDGVEAGNMGKHKTVYDAEVAALQAWGADVWGMRATWRK